MQMRVLYVVLAGLLLAGCWQSKTQLYGSQKPVTPFRAGKATSTASDGQIQHYALTRHGARYRLTITDKGEDFGEGFELAFFPLPGAPDTVFAYQAATLDEPVTDTSLRYYGLVVRQKDGIAEIRPSCEKDSAAAAVSGTKAGADDACTFTDRAGLEASLLALWKSNKKPEYTYTLR